MTTEPGGRDTEQSVAEFVAAAREFCDWIEDSPNDDDDTERFTALVLLSNLYARALHLPEVDSASLPPPPDHVEEDPVHTERIMTRLGRFPGREYWRLDRPTDENADKVADDLGRDLYLTYCSVRDSLETFDSGVDRRGSAIWSWTYTFYADWGRHATHAIQVLHEHFHEKAWSDEDGDA